MGSGRGENMFRLSHRRGGAPLKILKLNREEYQLQSDLDLVSNDEFVEAPYNDTNEKGRNICNIVRPRASVRTGGLR